MNKKYLSSSHLLIPSAIVLIAIIFRAVYLIIISKYPNFNIYYAGLDAELYHLLAKRLAGGDLLLGNDVYYYSPFYAYLLGGLYALFGVNTWVPRIFNICLGSATVWFIYAYTSSYFKSRNTGYVAATLAAFYGPFIVFDTSTLKSTSGLFFMAASIYVLSLSLKSRSIWLSIISGICIGLAMIDFGHMIFFVIALCVWLLVAYKGCHDEMMDRIHRENNKKTRSMNNTTWNKGLILKRRFAILVPMIIGILLTIAPFTIRNYIAAKDLVLTACTSGIHLFIGNHEGAWGGYNRIHQIRPNPAGHYFDAAKLAEEVTGGDVKASEVSRFWKDQAISYIKKNPADFWALCGKRIFLSLHPYEIDNNENFQYLTKISSYLSCFLTFGILMPIGIMGMIFALPRYKSLFPLYLFFICYLFALSISFVTWRYRIPLTLSLFPFSSFAIVSIIESIKVKRFLYAVTAIGLCLGIHFVFQLNPVKAEIIESGLKKAEGKMVACKKEAVLVRQLEQSFGSEEHRVAVWLQLARLHVTQYDIEGGLRYLEEALTEYPGNSALKINIDYLSKPDKHKK